MSDAMSISESRSRAGTRIIGEVGQLAIVSLYLYLVFVALLLYTMSIAGAEHVSIGQFGYAAIKALVLGKFVVMGHWFGVGERRRSWPLIHTILYRSVMLWLFLIALWLLEHLIEALVNERSLRAALADVINIYLYQMLTRSLLVLLMLLPYVALRQVGRTMGPGGLRRMLLAAPAEPHIN
jgi:hypothetical protein